MATINEIIEAITPGLNVELITGKVSLAGVSIPPDADDKTEEGGEFPAVTTLQNQSLQANHASLVTISKSVLSKVIG